MNKKKRLRRLWYVRKRNIKYYRILLCITTICLFFTLLWFYTITNLFPLGLTRFEDQIADDIKMVIDKNSDQFIRLNNMNVIEIEKDGSRVISAKVDNLILNKLSVLIEEDLKRIYISKVDNRYIPIKITIFPFDADINLGGVKINDVETSYINKYDRSNDKKMSILINVTITYEYLLGEKSRKYEFNILDARLE